MTLNTRPTHTQKAIPIDCDGVLLTNVPCHMVPTSILWFREYWTTQLKVHLKPDRKKLQYQIIQHTSMATPTFGMYVFQEESILITKNVAIVYGMHIVNGVHRPEPRSSWGNTSSNPQFSALIPRSAFNGMVRMCKRHGSYQNSHPAVLVRKPLCNQFIHYHISNVFFWYQSFQSPKFCCSCNRLFFAAVDRGSILAKIYRWSVMIYGKLTEIEMSLSESGQHPCRNSLTVHGFEVLSPLLKY